MSAESPIPLTVIEEYRDHTYRHLQRLRLGSAEQAVEFVNQRGFIFFWPNKGVELPSLWGAVAGNRPVPNNHDDPAHVTWRWKDDMLEKKHWYYARILRKRSTILSLDLLPSFYALSPNYGTPEEDYLIEYQQGNLSQEEKIVYETLLDQGALNTIALRKESHLASSENSARFNRALDNLQKDFRILPVGIAEAGAWHYSHIYDASHRIFPDMIDQARQIKRSQARLHILESYFLSVGAAQFRDIQKIFRWTKEDIQRSLQSLIQDRKIKADITLENSPENWFILAKLAA